MASHTNAELREFDRLTMAASSQSQMARISARLSLRKFVSLHGAEKCDAMFLELTTPKPKRKKKQ